MFRYLAISWDDALPGPAERASDLTARLLAQQGWQSAHAGEGLCVLVNGVRAGANEVYPLPSGNGTILGRLFRRRDLHTSAIRPLQLTAAENDLIHATMGRSLIDEFWGRYVAFAQDADGSTSVLRDPSGALPCFLTRHDGIAIVFSWLDDLLALLDELPHPRVNWEALAAHMLLGDIGGRETVLEGISQVVPGEQIALSSGRSELLWNATTIAQVPTDQRFDDAAESLAALTRSCTRAWASCHETLLLRLSGGLDSSILLTCLGPDDAPADVICVNYHSQGSDSDERSYARLAAAKVGRDLIERERDAEFQISSVLEIARTPSPVSYVGWMNSRVDTKLASAYGASAMFTGVGGDYLFFEFREWWPAADYLRWRGLDRGFLSATLDAARLGNVSVWRAAGLAFLDRLNPGAPWRELSTRMPLFGPALSANVSDLSRFVHPALRHPSDLPIGKRLQTAALIHPLGYYDPFERDAAPELVSPLLSQPLVELCLKLPTYLLTQGGRGRALARRAFAKELPRQIAERRAKGGMEEHLRGILARQLDFARQMLLDGELVSRGFLDGAKVEEALSGRPTALVAHPTQLHGLIGVEAWLSRWPGYRRRT